MTHIQMQHPSSIENAYDAVLFDLDGTLWDATHVTAKIWPGVLANHPDIHRAIDLATVQQYMGKTNAELATLLFPELPFEAGYALMMEACVMENKLLTEEGGILYPALLETLSILAKSHPLGIISNCQSGYIEAFLTHHKATHLFVDHICSDDTGKPKGENIRLLADRNDFQNPVYIGDTMGDATAAKEAGCDFIWASYGFGTVSKEMYTAVVATPMELVQLL